MLRDHEKEKHMANTASKAKIDANGNNIPVGAEAGLLTFYGSSFINAEVLDGSTIKSVIIENTTGVQAITGKIYIEGTIQAGGCSLGFDRTLTIFKSAI